MTLTRRRKMRKTESSGSQPRLQVTKPKKCGDIKGILLLTALYTLQGLPLGLSSAVPYILQANRQTANYQHQAIFSWVLWPFALKLAWAPIVDAVYNKRLGRRKSWLLPVQYALGIDFFVLGGRVDRWLGRPVGDPWGPLGTTGDVQIWPLTIAFFGLTVLAATQDIVVDGWALTMLSRENVGWASTCNTAGQTIGYIIGFMFFLAFESPEVCNNYLRSVPVPGKGLISFSGFLYGCGALFILSTTLVAIFKREKDESVPEPKGLARQNSLESSNTEADGSLIGPRTPLILTEQGELEPGAMLTPEPMEAYPTLKCLSLWQTYCVMLGILRLRPVLRYIVFVFIVKFVFSATDAVFGLKLLEHGVSKERMALIGSAVLPLQAILPILVTRWSNGPRPLGVYLNAAVPRALVALTSVLIIYFVDYFKVETPKTPDLLNNSTGTGTGNVTFSSTFYFILVTQFVVYSIFMSLMNVCQIAFHARVSDPSIGGTYMTLLNTVSNMAGSLPSTTMLFFVEPLTLRSCDNATLEKAITAVNSTASDHSKLTQLAEQFLLRNVTCKNPDGVSACRAAGGSCRTIVDGLYLEVGFCFLVGIVTYFTLLRRMAKSLDSLPLNAYRFRRKSSSPEQTGASNTFN